MAENNVGMNPIPSIRIDGHAHAQNRSWAYLLKEPIQDEYSFSTKKNTKQDEGYFAAFMTYVAEIVRRINIMNAPEIYMDQFLNEDFIKASLNQHYEEISDLLGQYGYKPEIKMDHLEVSRNHFLTTYNLAKNLTSTGQYHLDEQERETLLEAALLHDIGKSLIPNEVFAKPGRLTPDEKKVMDLHSEIGYLLLKDSGLGEKTLNAVRNHHHKELTNDKITEILSMCDVISALKENRCYKKGKKDKDTVEILRQDRDSGKLDPEVVNTSLNIMSYDTEPDDRTT